LSDFVHAIPDHFLLPAAALIGLVAAVLIAIIAQHIERKFY